MEWISDSNILIVGLGLMGGSYARALHRLGFHVTAIDARSDALDFALERGFIDRGYVEPRPEVLSRADAVIFALYPGIFREWLEENQRYFRPGAMLTDVTGVKSCLVYDIQAMLRSDLEYSYVGRNFCFSVSSFMHLL